MNANAPSLTQALRRVRFATEKAQRELDELDALAGDGDHGITMVLGWRAVEAALAQHPASTPGAVLRDAAEAFASVGGSAGPLWGTALLRAGRALGDAEEVDVSAIAEAAAQAAAGMQERGRSVEGDRTVVDAMAPAAAALARAAQRGASLEDALHEAAEAAITGAENTSSLEPRRGRAALAPDRAVGRPDAGARAGAIFWSSASECSPIPQPVATRRRLGTTSCNARR